jgi:hypothetical protein
MGFVIIWLGIAVVTGLAASSRGRSGFGWFLLGLLFSFLALLAVLVMAPRQPKSTYYDPAQKHVPAPMAPRFTCSECGQAVGRSAKFCQSCGEPL